MKESIGGWMTHRCHLTGGASNHLMVIWLRDMVLSDYEKATPRGCQVWIYELNASEPLKRCREVATTCQKPRSMERGERARWKPVYWSCGRRHINGRTYIRAWLHRWRCCWCCYWGFNGFSSSWCWNIYRFMVMCVKQIIFSSICLLLSIVFDVIGNKKKGIIALGEIAKNFVSRKKTIYHYLSYLLLIVGVIFISINCNMDYWQILIFSVVVGLGQTILVFLCMKLWK